MLHCTLLLTLLTTSHAWVLQSNVKQVTPGHTPNVHLECHYDLGDDGDAFNLNKISTIRITKLDPFGVQGTFAEIRENSPPNVKAGDETAVTGSLNELEEAFLKITWSKANESTTGAYGCEISGFDQVGNFGKVNAKYALIKEKILTMDDVENRIRAMTERFEKRQRSLESENEKLKAFFQNGLETLQKEVAKNAERFNTEIKEVSESKTSWCASKPNLAKEGSPFKKVTRNAMLNLAAHRNNRSMLQENVGNETSSCDRKLSAMHSELTMAFTWLQVNTKSVYKGHEERINNLNSTLRSLVTRVKSLESQYRYFRIPCGDTCTSPSTGVPSTPAASTPTTSAPTTSPPESSAPTTSAPTTSAPTTSAPTTSAPTTSAPTTSPTESSAPTTSAPTTSAPTTSAPTTSPPESSALTTSAPTTSAPTTSAPTTSAPTTSLPECSALTTSAPTTSAPTTSAPTTSGPTTSAPTTSPPESSAPTTSAPTTSPPESSAPTTSAPTTSPPESSAPTTSAPTTSPPESSAPTTLAPTTSAPTTSAPTTSAPPTSAPTTSPPESSAPTASAPTTSAPITSAPTTSAPTTSAPTTSPPESSAPTTSAPTTSAPKATTPTTTSPPPMTWPGGHYGLVKTASGCPHFKRPSQSDPVSIFSSLLQFVVGSDTSKPVDLRHCWQNGDSSSSQAWPRGSYCILSNTGDCPSGFKAGSIEFIRSLIIFTQKAKLHYCCRSDGAAKTPIRLPTESPFYLMRYNKKCQSVADMTTQTSSIWARPKTLQSIYYTKERGYHPDVGHLPLVDIVNSIYVCRYTV